MNTFLRRSVTLIELLIAVSLIGVLVLGIGSLDTFSRYQLIASERRAVIQNELSIAMEDMSKSAIRATGNFDDPGIVDLGNGFRVRVDENTTPDDYGDDPWISYVLLGNTIEKDGVSLNRRAVITGFTHNVLDNGKGVDISLTAIYDTTQAASLDNPEMTMNTRVYSYSAGP